jgi:hypothetical protein
VAGDTQAPQTNYIAGTLPAAHAAEKLNAFQRFFMGELLQRTAKGGSIGFNPGAAK